MLGGFLNAGQACASVERVYAVGATYEPLLERVVALTQKMRLGQGGAADYDIGPMIVDTQLDIVRRHVDEAVAAGARVHTGGKVVDGRYYAPTVLSQVDESMAICRDETFGPVLPIKLPNVSPEA